MGYLRRCVGNAAQHIQKKKDLGGLFLSDRAKKTSEVFFAGFA
jgi:hypothetical protein